MWKLSPHDVSQCSLVPSSLPLEDSFILSTPTPHSKQRQRQRQQDGSLSSINGSSLGLPASSSISLPLAVGLLTPNSLLLSSPPSFEMVRSSLSMSDEQCTTPADCANATDCAAIVCDEIPESPPWHSSTSSHHSQTDSGEVTLTDALIRSVYHSHPCQRTAIDPYTIYCALADNTDGTALIQRRDSLPVSRPISPQHTPHALPFTLLPYEMVPQSMQSSLSAVASPSPPVAPTPADASPQSAVPPASQPADCSLSFEMSYVDLPSQLHRLHDTPADELKFALTSATLSLSYQSTPRTATVASQLSALDMSMVSPAFAVPFPQLSDGSPAAAVADVRVATPQPRRRVGAFCVEQSGVLFPNMRSALLPAAEANSLSEAAGVSAAAAVAAFSPSVVLPAASPELRGACTVACTAILAGLSECGCYPYHLRVLRLASAVALESLCERESLFAMPRYSQLGRVGCTSRCAAVGGPHSISSGHSLTNAADSGRGGSAAAKQERAGGRRAGAAAEQSESCRWVVTVVPSQSSEFVHHTATSLILPLSAPHDTLRLGLCAVRAVA